MSNGSEIGWDRRRLIRGLGAALLTVQFLPSPARALASSPGEENEAAQNLIIRSGLGFVPHTHDLLLPYAVLSAPPPRGVRLLSTRALFHTHEVALSQEQLVAIGHGGTVSVAGGSHIFVIALSHTIGDRRLAPLEFQKGA